MRLLLIPKAEIFRPALNYLPLGQNSSLSLPQLILITRSVLDPFARLPRCHLHFQEGRRDILVCRWMDPWCNLDNFAFNFFSILSGSWTQMVFFHHDFPSPLVI